MASTAARVAKRYVRQQRCGGAIADPATELRAFRAAVEHFAQWEVKAHAPLHYMRRWVKSPEPEFRERLEDEIQELDEVSRDVRIELTHNQKRFFEARAIARDLFLSLLQQYVLDAKVRRGVEAALKFWSRKSIKPRLKVKYGIERDLALLEAYIAFCATMRTHVTVAELAIANGTLNSHPELEETVKHRAGSFTLVNAGGFKAEQMKGLIQLVEKAEHALRGVGLGKVCYGEILITKTIQNKATISAFYLLNSDEMFIRGNVKPQWDVVKTVCHELAHRLQNKFLKSKKNEIDAIYRRLKTESFSGDVLDPSIQPKPGDIAIYAGQENTAIRVSRHPGKVYFTITGVPNTTYSMSTDGWLRMKGIEPHQRPNFRGFVTRYAGTSPDENFAEMVAHYALGKLPDVQVPLLMTVLE